MGKAILLDIMQHKPTERPAWVPFAGIHSGKLKGYTAEEVLKDPQKHFEALIEVAKLYQPDGMPIMFDLQLEAEILGCDLLWARDNPPSVASHPLAGDEPTVPCRCTIPTKTSGRIPHMLEVMNRLKAAVGDEIALYGLICGPLTLASHLRGSDIFMDMVLDEDYVAELTQFCTEVSIKMAEYYIEAGMDIIAVVDPLVSQISPDHFNQFFKEPFTELFDFIRMKGVYSSFFVCGNATQQIEPMCTTNPDSIAVDENVDLKAAKVITDRFNIAISGNIPLTTVMLHGSQPDNMKYVVDLVDSVAEIGLDNLIISPGCDMPYDVPIENTIACAQAVQHHDQIKAMMADYEAVEDDLSGIELPDYAHLARPLIEVFTLDSVQCAACTYMMAAANRAKAHFGDRIDVVEYKYTIKENILRTKKMGVRNLPTMVINGEPRFVSLIPSEQDLFGVIDGLLAEQASS